MSSAASREFDFRVPLKYHRALGRAAAMRV